MVTNTLSLVISFIALISFVIYTVLYIRLQSKYNQANLSSTVIELTQILINLTADVRKYTETKIESRDENDYVSNMDKIRLITKQLVNLNKKKK